MQEVLRVLQEVFRGTYVFERHVSLPVLIYNGTASFVETSSCHHRYDEEGSYQLDGYKQDVYQRRDFLFHVEHFLMLKSDGSILHHFDYPISNSMPLSFSHTHVCKDDFYHCTFTIESENEFSTQYRITGPSKEYEIRTTYHKSQFSQKSR